MFGSFFHKYGEKMAGDNKEWFASRLVAEVLNRARVVELAFERYEDEGGDAALGALCVALEHFSDDCDEARIRGRRAQMFGASVSRDNWMEADAIETDEQLEEIGGAYVPLEEQHARELAELAEHKVERLISMASSEQRGDTVTDPVVRICAKTLLQAIDDAHGKHEDKND